MKPYYQDEWVTIYNCRCEDILGELPKVDLVLTDPPWNLGYFKDDDKPWEEYAQWLETFKQLFNSLSDNTIIFQSTKAIPYVAHLFKGWEMFSSLKNFCQMTPKKLPNAFDLAFIKNSEKYLGKGRNWHLANNANLANSQTGHPTSRPLDCIKYLISLYDYNTILDPFAGSCTTGRAAKDLNRKCICIELEEKYCEIGAKRMCQEVMNFA